MMRESPWPFFSKLFRPTLANHAFQFTLSPLPWQPLQHGVHRLLLKRTALLRNTHSDVSHERCYKGRTIIRSAGTFFYTFKTGGINYFF